MKKPILLLCSLTLGACATGYTPTYSMNKVQVVNLTGGTIENVSWQVIGSGKTLNCSEVANSGICDENFPTRRYPQSGIEVNWTHPDGERKTAILNPHVEAYFSRSFPLEIYLEIDAEGSINAFYRQNTPDGRPRFIFGS
jgi:hypothetical protein